MTLFWIGAALVMAGAFLLYLASPNQSVTAATLPRRALAWGGAAGLSGGQAVLLGWAGPATAVFIALTFASLVWSIVPLVFLWLGTRNGAKR